VDDEASISKEHMQTYATIEYSA